MKIYTYYTNIRFRDQDELIHLWKESWERMGFEAIVLNEKYAQMHPDYQDFIDKIRFIHSKVTGKPIKLYGLCCYVRWLAYAMVGRDEDPTTPAMNERFLVSDYDVINNGWKPSYFSSEKMHFLDADCPCLANGSPAEFDLLCRAFFDVTMMRIEDIGNVPEYHDQDFFINNFTKQNNLTVEKLLKKYNMVMTRNPDEHVAPFNPDKKQNCKAFHISHNNTGKIVDIYPEKYNLSDYKHRGKCLDKARIEIIKEIFKDQENDNI